METIFTKEEINCFKVDAEIFFNLQILAIIINLFLTLLWE